jgi:hypothetical protein
VRSTTASVVACALRTPALGRSRNDPEIGIRSGSAAIRGSPAFRHRACIREVHWAQVLVRAVDVGAILQSGGYIRTSKHAISADGLRRSRTTLINKGAANLVFFHPATGANTFTGSLRTDMEQA